MSLPVLQATGVSRSFGNAIAVHNVDISLSAGTITGLVGPNGAGKTTLLLMLAGLLAPDTGQVTVCGHSMGTDPRAARALIGWLPDTFGTWGGLRVKETVSLFGQMYGLSPALARERAQAVLEQVHLDDLAQRPARVLSRGQKQRLGLARALIHQPRVLLLDEPAAGMDPRSRVELRQILRTVADSGAGVLISSHVLSELEDTIDTAVFMLRSRTVDPAVFMLRSRTVDPAAMGLMAAPQSFPSYRLGLLDTGPWAGFAADILAGVLPKVTWVYTQSSPAEAPKINPAGPNENGVPGHGEDHPRPSGPGSVTVSGLQNETEVAQLVALAAGVGLAITSLSAQTHSLEDTYLRLDAERI